MADAGNDGYEDIEASVKKLSLASSSSDSKQLDPFGALLRLCGQSAPLKFRVVFFTYCNLEKINKIVPIEGNLLVNGEVQKVLVQ
ncbi:hypothetical protein PS1_010234 [Malus domestica]